MLAGELKKQQNVLAGADGVALLGSFALALALHDPGGAMEGRLLRHNPVLLCLNILAVVCLWIAVFRACDLYRAQVGGVREWRAIVRGCSYAALLTVLVGFLAHLDVSRITVVTGYLLSVPSVAIGRGVARLLMRSFYANPRTAVPLVIVGFNRFARQISDEVLDAMTPYEVMCFLDHNAAEGQYRGCPIIGPIEKLPELIKVCPSLEVAIVLPDAARIEQERIAEICERHHVRWSLMPWVSRWPAGGISVEMFGAVPLISPRGSRIEGLNFMLKRTFDVAVGSLMLALLAPVLLLAALAVRLCDGPPVLFRQQRVGLRGNSFEMLKFRTMRVAAADASHREYVKRWIRDGAAASAESAGGSTQVFKLTRDDRITGIGRILRRFSIDELPQLINVIRGEMSLIGPRPALPYEVESYKPWHLRRLDGAPGITGLWQVSGRNQLSFDEMVRLDVEYLQEWSLGRDLRILARTVPAMLRGGGL
jgi:exopolysaccharide biosynthesis polyprenyl glycosylphosphotransferase